MIPQLSFQYPQFFYALLIIPLLIVWHLWKVRPRQIKVRISDIQSFSDSKKSLRQRLLFLPFTFRILCISFVIIALARPQSNFSGKEENVEGVDIMLALDVSGSMLAEDFVPNRLEAAKSVASSFIQGRNNDRMGLVIFSGETYTQCPLTIDHNILQNQLKAIHSGMIPDGTAIGDGLATAINRLKSSTAVSKTIVLLTDGVNNQGSVDPLSAAEMASLYGIRVYTIGVGTRGTAPYPVETPFGKQYQNVEVQIDETMLTEISKITDAQYFRATNKNKLKGIFEEIDQMEKSKIEVLSYEHKNENFAPFLWLALLFFLLEILLSLLLFKTTP